MALQLIAFSMTISYIILAFIPWYILQNDNSLAEHYPRLKGLAGSVILVFSGVCLFASFPVKNLILKIKKNAKDAVFTSLLISLVVREAGVIFAFIYSFSNADSIPVFVAAAVGVILNITTWPKN